FYVIPDKESHQNRLLEALQWEWKQYLPLLQGKTLSTIYFGGGTPSLFGPERLDQLLQLIGNSPIQLSKEVEITLEANPERIKLPLMREYAKAGVNRVSMGIQTLDADLLHLLGRLHGPEEAKQAVFTVVEAGIDNLSIDLMYDLPKQTLQHWEQTLDQIKELPITHLSLYNLTIEPHTVFFKKQAQLNPLLPDAETSMQMYKMAIERLEAMGLMAYEISAFAKPGFFSRHNTGYWTGRPFLGLGPSAFSYWEGSRFRNVAHLNQYYEALEKGGSPIDFEEKLGVEASRRELFVIRLRLRCGVSLNEFENRYGPLEEETRDKIKQFVREGLLSFHEDQLGLTWQGMLCYDSIAAELI
ncbi:MAG: radical SAM family heme chaperone HemW, partial [Chlamydiales bacterium]